MNLLMIIHRAMQDPRRLQGRPYLKLPPPSLTNLINPLTLYAFELKETLLPSAI